LRAGAHEGAAGAHVENDLTPAAADPLAELRRDLDAEGVAVESVELENTSAARALHEAAEERDAGLLIVGSTNRGAAGRVLVGSTAERLMHGAPCPIAIVPHGWQAGADLNTIGVAFVDTDEGHEALRGAYALARRAGAKLRVLTAVKPGVRTTYGAQNPGGDVQHGKRKPRSKASCGCGRKASCATPSRPSTATSRSRATCSWKTPRTC
jgi:nucleotide-binding universal stress UspA family protein